MKLGDVCNNCPLRLYNTKQYNLQGVGNPYYGKCIVVPNVDYVAYKNGSMGFSTQVELIKSIISSTGELNDVYITPLIKCNENIGCDVNDEIYNNCLTHLGREFIKYGFKDVLLLGEAVRRILNCNINEYVNSLMISNNNIRYAISYSPLVKYVDDDKFNEFKSHLLRWYNSVNSFDFSTYNVIRL